MNAFNVVPAQVLIHGDPEPEVGSVIIDSHGVAHQRRVLTNAHGDSVDQWFEAGFNIGASWESVQIFGPLVLVAVSFAPVEAVTADWNDFV